MLETYKSGDFETCLNLSEKLLLKDPDNTSALLHRARIHTKRREFDLSKPYWNRLTQLNPSLPEPFLQSARIAHREKDWPECESYIEAFLAHKGEHPEALKILTHCYIFTENAGKIETAFARLLKVAPQGIPALALSAIQNGMSVEVANAVRKVADTGDQAALDLCGSLARAERDAGISYEIRKNSFSASRCYRAMRIYARGSIFPRKALERLNVPFIEMARRAYREKKYEDAVARAETCIEIDSELAEPYIIAGRSSAQLGRHEQAFNYFAQEIERFWAYSWLVVNYARAAAKTGKTDIAYMAYEAVSKRTDEKSVKFAAECAKQMGRFAADARQEILTLAAHGDVLLACNKLFAHQHVGSKPDDFAELLSEIGEQCQKELQNFVDVENDKALELATSFARLDPRADYACRIAGRILSKNNKHAEALYYWTQLIRLDKKDTESVLGAALCYDYLGNRIEAAKMASKLLAMDPQNKEGKRILNFAN